MELLDESTVAAYLTGRGLIADHSGVRVRTLGGGVSNVVLAAETSGARLVVKQSLDRLRVAEQWLAPRDRVLTEADGLELAGRLTPGAVPRVVDRDAERCAIVIECAPGGWSDWKSRLLGDEPGETDVGVARRLGELLARWQQATVDGLDGRFADAAAFDALRIDPYYRALARRRPEYADRVGGYAGAMAGRRSCLSHGDFSPKNVLVGDTGLWMIDFEVAHRGDPAFDLAFLLSHLLLKSLHRPQWVSRYGTLAASFTSAYTAHANRDLAPDWAYVSGHVGCLVLARVHGKSPAEYLTAAGQQAATRLGAAVLDEPPTDPRGLWTILRTMPREAT